MTDDSPSTALTDEQRARAEALAISRAALTDNGQAFVSHNAIMPKRFGTQDLIDVAQWILDGSDPLAAYREESERRVEEHPPFDPPTEKIATPGSVQRDNGRG